MIVLGSYLSLVELGAALTSTLALKGEWPPDREGSELASCISSSIAGFPNGDLFSLEPGSFFHSELPLPPPGGGTRGAGGQSVPVFAKKKS